MFADYSHRSFFLVCFVGGWLIDLAFIEGELFFGVSFSLGNSAASLEGIILHCALGDNSQIAEGLEL